jgi:ERCC4-related helicase
VVLLIFDEAHRATNNYAYCRIVNFLENAKVPYRLIALSATPGSTNEQV